MRSLRHRDRSEVAKESIIRLCEANNISRHVDRKRIEHIGRMLNDEPNLLHSGTQVQLCVTSTHLNVISVDAQQIIIQHEMPNVSFASSGDEDTVDFVAYVAKDAKFGRACFVLECGHETAKNVLETIARGFQLRSQQILYNSSTFPLKSSTTIHLTTPQENSLDLSYQFNDENESSEEVIKKTRSSLEKEPWFHGSYLSRETSEKRLKKDGDFLVRESMLELGHFVLSVMHNGEKLHLLFDSMGQVRTKEMEFNDISHLVKYHYDGGTPIVADNRIVYLRNGIKPG